MLPSDSRDAMLRQRYPDILPPTDEDAALLRLVDDLDHYMQDMPTPAPPFQSHAQPHPPLLATDGARTGASHSQPRSRRLGRARQQLGVWMAAVAAVLVVALLGGALLTRMRATPGQSHPGIFGRPTTVATCDPKKVTARLPAHSSFGSLSMVSPTEGWAVGAIQDPATFVARTLILHFHNCAWTPIATSFPDAVLQSVSMGSATDGWAVGMRNNNAPLVLHYANGVWKEARLPGEDTLQGVYSSAHMLSADDGWIVINHTKDSQGYLTNGLLRLANGHWSTVNLPFPVVEAVLPVAPNDAWFAGSASDIQEEPHLYHYQAGTWTSVASPNGVVIDDLRMVSPNDIWASGHISSQNGGQIGTALHYDGSQWRQVALGASGHPQQVEALDGATSWAFTLQQPQNGGVPGGPGLTISTAQYQQNGVWRAVPWSFAGRLTTLTRVEPETFWAIGYYEVNVTVSQGNGSSSGYGYPVPVLLYFANGAWHRYGG